jgi:hypothetical protein
MPEYLRAKYPDDMTIVLQHQYWGLEVAADAFEVTVSFNKRNERLKVPFAALSAFVDPSVRFGLQFEKRGAAASLPAPEKRPALAGPATAGAETKPRGEPAAAPSPPADEPAPAAEAPDGDAKEGGAKVVTLDAFRKKP